MLVAVACGVVLLSSALAAHHANAVFDLGKRVTVIGTVTEWFWPIRTAFCDSTSRTTAAS
jgi:hypothetical protein